MGCAIIDIVPEGTPVGIGDGKVLTVSEGIAVVNYELGIISMTQRDYDALKGALPPAPSSEVAP